MNTVSGGRWTNRAIAALRADLQAVEHHARDLSWASTTPWRAWERVSTERRLRIRRERDQRIVRVDLHGLDATGARMACTQVRRALLTPDHPLRYVRVVVGKGNRSIEGRRVLAGIAMEILQPEPPLSVRTSTEGAENGFVDVWHRERWPRAPIRRSR